MRKPASTSFKLACIAFMIFANLWVLTRPYLHRPFSKYSAYDWGYKMAGDHRDSTGKLIEGNFPNDCPDLNCIAHHGGFWHNFLTTK